MNTLALIKSCLFNERAAVLDVRFWTQRLVLTGTYFKIGIVRSLTSACFSEHIWRPESFHEEDGEVQQVKAYDAGLLDVRIPLQAKMSVPMRMCLPSASAAFMKGLASSCMRTSNIC